ncbi:MULTISPECIES: ATP-binding cassette domain-containing protein [unclassified Streptomyces]|uniref:ATP-binding cassette domain-containing protein n=1 Tax=unclassified Streptomyces TaxID=2593676 RepID=UPI00081F45F7|nr:MULTISPECIES: ATP-binding cassette domain-containing protein [unclassified Streptomyces]MYR24751.1 ATP-binding cassette domain-containing protein [Streptomyces sp. SID4945]SCE66550.1 ABC transporter [Streptomyces sp. LcepLS]
METEHRGAALDVLGLGLKGPRGWVFRGIGFHAEPGALLAVTGASGSGRTCLLLALCGRMRTHEGSARVAGLPLPRRLGAVRRIAALAHVPGVSELDPALTVAEHVRERALLERGFALLPRRRAERGARAEAALAAAGLDPGALPKGPRTAVRDLERVEALRLALALALFGRPRLLAVDDIDLKLSDDERAEVWALLRTLAASGVTVLAVCGEPPEDAQVIRTDSTGNEVDDRAVPATRGA